MQGINDGGGLAREAIQAALRSHGDATARIRGQAQQIFESSLAKAELPNVPSGAQAASSLGSLSAQLAGALSGELPQPSARSTSHAEPSSLMQALHGVNAAIADGERLPGEFLAGEIGDVHEVVTRIRKAELAMDFALEIRNKLVESYREVMRMTV